MNKSSVRLITLLTLSSALMLGGCATTKEFNELKASVASNSQAIAAAQNTADQALKEASAARAAAENAEQAANAAKAAAEATDAKIDNMFKKTMQKSG